MPKPKNTITPSEAADMLGITPDAVRKLIKLRKLTAKRYDTFHWGIDPVSLERWKTRKTKARED